MVNNTTKEYSEISLTQGRVAIVDRADFEYLSQYKWYAVKRGYAIGTVNGSEIRMHRFILNAKRGEIIDHINGNGFDNRRSNLRLCTQAQNSANKRMMTNNSTGYKGVSVSKEGNRFVVFIGSHRKRTHKFVGSFITAEEAARAYDEAAVSLYGEFALTNERIGNYKTKGCNQK